MTTRTDPKNPAEEVTLEFDFTKMCAKAGVSGPTAPTVYSGVRVGNDPAHANTRDGAPFVVGTKVFQRMIGGLDRVDYTFVCLADVGDQRLQIDMIVPVRVTPTQATTA